MSATAQRPLITMLKALLIASIATHGWARHHRSTSSDSSADFKSSLHSVEPCEFVVSPRGLVNRILNQLPTNTPEDVRQGIIIALSKIPGVEPPPPPAPPALNATQPSSADTTTPVPPVSPDTTPAPATDTTALIPNQNGSTDAAKEQQAAAHVSSFQRLLQWLGYTNPQPADLKSHIKEQGDEHHKKDDHHGKKDHDKKSKEHDKDHHGKEDHGKKSKEKSHETKKHKNSEDHKKKPQADMNKLRQALLFK
ncbi:IgGFc-binding protein-like isoform X1 [Ditylenchus destructor]|nr:IgGFc-binding protein-like isoform X1 [Ditylenchus destructor]